VLQHRNNCVLPRLHLRAADEEHEMINDDLNRNPNLDTSGRNDLNRNSLDRADRTGMGGGMIGLIVAAAVIAVLFMWAPWSGPRVADNAGPGTTVGSSTTRPAAPMAPNTAPAPAAPAAPTTPR
jgi:hypothetical protein